MSHRARGLSLLEVMIASVVLSGITLTLYSVCHTGSLTFSTASRQDTLRRSARVALDRIAEELRSANPDSLVVSAQALSFQKATGFSKGKTTWSATIEYGCELSDVDANDNGKKDEKRLYRKQGTEKVRLCNYLKSNGFSATQSGSRVTITLTLGVADDGGDQTVTVTTSILLRNKSSV